MNLETKSIHETKPIPQNRRNDRGLLHIQKNALMSIVIIFNNLIINSPNNLGVKTV